MLVRFLIRKKKPRCCAYFVTHTFFAVNLDRQGDAYAFFDITLGNPMQITYFANVQIYLSGVYTPPNIIDNIYCLTLCI